MADVTFDTLWAVWPKRPRRGSRKDAERRWETLSTSDQAECLTGAQAASESSQWAQGYEPGVARWINGRLWEAYLEPGTEAADTLSEKDWRLWEFWVRRVGRHRAAVCQHDPECLDGDVHMRKVLSVLRLSM